MPTVWNRWLPHSLWYGICITIRKLKPATNATVEHKKGTKMNFNRVLLSFALTVVLLPFPGCRPPMDQGDHSQDAAKRQNDTAVESPKEATSPNPDTGNDKPSAGVSVEVGGGKGVDVDVNLPSIGSNEVRSDGKKGLQVDVGHGAVDVRVGSGNGKKEQ
jgi:hypothetical protein